MALSCLATEMTGGVTATTGKVSSHATSPVRTFRISSILTGTSRTARVSTATQTTTAATPPALISVPMSPQPAPTATQGATTARCLSQQPLRQRVLGPGRQLQLGQVSSTPRRRPRSTMLSRPAFSLPHSCLWQHPIFFSSNRLYLLTQ